MELTKSPAKSPVTAAVATTSRQATEPTQSPAKSPTIETAATASAQTTEEAATLEHTWVVWQDARGIWVGTQQDFKQAKRPDSIVCDVIDRGAHRVSAALNRAIQLAQTLRQSYANHMKYWVQYDDAAQRQRIQEWYERM